MANAKPKSTGKSRHDAIADDDLIDEADVENASCEELIAQLEATDAGENHYDANVTILREFFDYHDKQEQDEMFPLA